MIQSQYDTEPWCFIDWVAENKTLIEVIAEGGQLHERCDVSKIGAGLKRADQLSPILLFSQKSSVTR